MRTDVTEGRLTLEAGLSRHVLHDMQKGLSDSLITVAMRHIHQL